MKYNEYITEPKMLEDSWSGFLQSRFFKNISELFIEIKIFTKSTQVADKILEKLVWVPQILLVGQTFFWFRKAKNMMWYFTLSMKNVSVLLSHHSWCYNKLTSQKLSCTCTRKNWTDGIPCTLKN